MHPAIELFRGIAALMVLTFHYRDFFISGVSFLNFLQTGVDLFFIISGFVFAPIIYSGNIAVTPYLIRRFFRIYPLYFVSLLLYYGFAPDHPQKFAFFIDHLFFLQTTSSIQEAAFFNGVTWTLPIEIEYYLLVPFLALLTVINKNTIYIVLILAILLKAILIITATELSDLNLSSNLNLSTILSLHLPSFLIEFMIGIILYNIYIKYKHKQITIIFHVLIIIIAMSLLLGLSLLLFLSDEYDNLLWKSYFRFWCAISYAILLFPFLIKLNKVDSFFYSTCLFMGNISYGVYLFHMLIPKVLNHLDYNLTGFIAYFTCLILTVILTLITYYLIENPARIFGRKLSHKF
jgi:exopolysaccharide production protein ExoZ